VLHKRLEPRRIQPAFYDFSGKGLAYPGERPIDTGYVRHIMPLVQDRARTLGEVPQLVDFFFVTGWSTTQVCS